jgi:Amt family ammonium transporter
MLSVLMQVSTVAAIGMITWVLWGYSLAFTDGGGLDSFVGGFSKAGLLGVGPSSNVETFSNGVVIPELVFVAFQMTFACITAALVLGSLTERVKFAGVVAFAVLWPLLSYYPLAHMVWWWAGATSAFGTTAEELSGGAGLIWAQGALDFAGGTVVHINAGIAALVGCIILGPRDGYRREPTPPHSLTLTLVGAGLLWVGWFGFNAGSNLEANGYAALAMVNTFVATAAAGLSWVVTEWVTRGRPSMLGLASGVIAGLVAVTPAAGFAGPLGSIVLGLIVSPICVVFCSKVKQALKVRRQPGRFRHPWCRRHRRRDRHGHPGQPGAWRRWGGGLHQRLDGYDAGAQIMAQLKGVGITIVWSGIASAIVFS